VRVSGVHQLSPTLRRLTLTGEALTTYSRFGPDEYFGLLIPPAGEAVRLITSDAADPRAAVAELPAAARPHLRWYSVRDHRPQVGELDVDMVTHGDNGRASHWAENVRVGDEAGFVESGYLYAPPVEVTTQLFVADETALPALGALLESGKVGTAAHAFVEVPHADDIQDLDTAATLTWVVRQGSPPRASPAGHASGGGHTVARVRLGVR
jgi:NADPH-dependent ferric siderophore reductase